MSMAHDEMIAVIAAHKEGKTIQYRARWGAPEGWQDTPNDPVWNFYYNEYRIKPEPCKPRVIYVNEYEGGGFGSGYAIKDSAVFSGAATNAIATRKFIEVIEEEQP
jgi:hypothetical protein